MSMRDCHVLASQYVAEKFGPQVPVPSYWTVRTAWLEWFGPGGTRHRYVRTAEALDPSQVHIVVHRPGQVVALDTTPLPGQLDAAHRPPGHPAVVEAASAGVAPSALASPGAASGMLDAGPACSAFSGDCPATGRAATGQSSRL
jgi:hypothetical protein